MSKYHSIGKNREAEDIHYVVIMTWLIKKLIKKTIKVCNKNIFLKKVRNNFYIVSLLFFLVGAHVSPLIIVVLFVHFASSYV